MKPANGSVNHTLVFAGVNENAFVGGGMNFIASDEGLWVMGAGRLDLLGESKPAWAYTYQCSWSGDEVIAAPNTPGNYNGFHAVGTTPPKNALGYSAELLNLTRNVRIAGTPPVTPMSSSAPASHPRSGTPSSSTWPPTSVGRTSPAAMGSISTWRGTGAGARSSMAW